MTEEKITDLTLLSSHEEVGNVRTFVFENNGLTWIAGQNQGYRLKDVEGSPVETERWFTLSSAPSEGTVNISTRISESKFKQALNKLEPGDKIESYELGGDFTWEDEDAPDVVMVAGGIGITPFRSILIDRDRKGKKLNAKLLYFNRTDEVPFREELERLEEKHPEFSMRVLVGERITGDRVIELAPDAKERVVYISGPEQMVDAIAEDLTSRGIEVKKDRFPGYDHNNY